ncbi:hypothetical protein [Cupriavidus pampae]|uniref:Lipoprotein n=1 Tax=Cupriavidus pampae TaxID=659251 RepID=A0ABN7YJR7_9BURK|nr:hypothetical protein [Cupriavidus pampae]CAG9173719.1 hypothetical protein LMG32289_02946 [Cupriavidus pampae]
MKSLLALLPILMLGACATRVDYQPATISNPQAVVQRVLYEQPGKRRPELVQVTDRYVEYGRGVKTVPTPGAAADAQTTTIRKGTRIYYRSIAETYLYQKNSSFVVEPRSATSRSLAKIYVEDELDAKRLVDALATLKAEAPAGE